MFLEANGIKLYYEKSGNGYPMILVHGNGENHHIFDKTTELLKDCFTVYTVDTRGHGESSPVSELHYDDMAEDIYSFISLLHLNKPILYGFSDGGIVGLLIAIKHPDALSHLVISGANVSPEGLKRKWLFLFKILYSVSKSPKLKLMIQEPNISDGALRTISVPTYITAGSRDIVREQHTRNIHENIPGSKLKLFSNETHSSYVVKNEKLTNYLIEIFKAQS